MLLMGISFISDFPYNRALTMNNDIKKISLFLLALFVVGCVTSERQVQNRDFKTKGGSEVPYKNLETKGESKIPFINKVSSAVSPHIYSEAPKRVAILPPQVSQKALETIADWNDVDPVGLFRIVFFGRFSVLPYEDLHIREVDALLAENQMLNPSLLAKIPPSRIGEVLDVDGLIYLELIEIENITGGIHSRTEYAAKLRMIDVLSEKELWRAQLKQNAFGGLIGKSSQLVDLIEFEKLNKNRPLAFRKVAEHWSTRVIDDFKKKQALIE